jgi:hypothetical protein
MPRIVKALYSADRARRVLVVERADGQYGLQVEKRYQNVYEGRLVAEGWQRLAGAPSVFETADIAEREARSQCPWLAAAPELTPIGMTTNEQLFEMVRRLVEAWCDRRCLEALRHVLAGYPLPSPFTDGWEALYEALRHIRASDRHELTDVKAETVDTLIAAVGDRLYRH